MRETPSKIEPCRLCIDEGFLVEATHRHANYGRRVCLQHYRILDAGPCRCEDYEPEPGNMTGELCGRCAGLKGD